MIHRTAGEGRDLLNFSLPLTSALQTLRRELGNYCRELISAHSWQPDWNQKLLVSKGKSLTTKRRSKLLENYWFLEKYLIEDK